VGGELGELEVADGCWAVGVLVDRALVRCACGNDTKKEKQMALNVKEMIPSRRKFRLA
jgi:hypothetical protein